MQYTDDNREIYTQLMQLMFLSKHRMYKIGEAYDLSVMQSGALSMLDPSEPKAMRVLSDYFMCDASTVTGLVDRLEARGLIKRENHPTDRRIKLLALTSEGAKLKAKIQDDMADTETARLDTILDASERKTLQQLLGRLIADSTN